MRVPAIVLALTISAPAASAGLTPTPAVERPNAQVVNSCKRTTSHYAGKSSIYRGDRIAPKKLTELPPAIGFMAVYRTVNGCEVPMTIVEYRAGRRP